MVDAGIGRLLIASLHQGIADVMPGRLSFYENWLTPPGLRGDKFGLGPLHAVLSFLRLEGQAAYERTMVRAGRYTAEWAYLEMPAVTRTVVRSLPMRLRARGALHLSGRLVKQTFRGSWAHVRLRRREGTVNIQGSIFCDVREAAAWPMCVFYCAAVEQFLQLFGVGARLQVRECRAAGHGNCTMHVTILGEHVAQPTAEAA